MKLVSFSGRAGAGKDEASRHLVEAHGYTRIAFADELKHLAKQVFGFSDETLWGPSALRNAPDSRFLRATHTHHEWEIEPKGEIWHCTRCSGEFDPKEAAPPCNEYVTPRLALQLIGEMMKEIYPAIWVERTLQAADKIAGPVVIPDLRFKREFDAVRAAGGKIIRLKREDSGIPGALGQHKSETEHEELSDTLFDAVVANDSCLRSLEKKVDVLLQSWA